MGNTFRRNDQANTKLKSSKTNNTSSQNSNEEENQTAPQKSRARKLYDSISQRKRNRKVNKAPIVDINSMQKSGTENGSANTNHNNSIENSIQRPESVEFEIVDEAETIPNKSDLERVTEPKKLPEKVSNSKVVEKSKDVKVPQIEPQRSEAPLRMEPIVFAQADFANKVKEIKKKVEEVEDKLKEFKSTESDVMYTYPKETLSNVMISVDNLQPNSEQQILERKQLMAEVDRCYKILEEKEACAKVRPESSKTLVDNDNQNLEENQEAQSNSCKKMYIPINSNKDDRKFENPDPTPPNSPVETSSGDEISSLTERMKRFEFETNLALQRNLKVIDEEEEL